MRSPRNGGDHQALRKAKRGHRRMQRMKMRSPPNGEDHQVLRKAKRGNRRMQRKHQLKVEITWVLKKPKTLMWR
jgi:hypothetical protein